jgi:hypothetical protein
MYMQIYKALTDTSVRRNIVLGHSSRIQLGQAVVLYSRTVVGVAESSIGQAVNYGRVL